MNYKMKGYEALGLVSGAISVISVVPQIHRNFVTRSSKDISTTMIVLTYISMSLGILYGVLIQHAAVYISDSAILSLYVALHLVKMRNGRVAPESESEQELVEV
jgi:uncharacterized protein with PQ loop repeat